jgi:hypothetical protein
MFQVETVSRIQIQAAHLKTAVEIDTRTHNGVHYIKVSKSGWLARLLCKDGSTLEKALTGSRLLTEITRCRDQVYRDKCGLKKYQCRPSKRAAAMIVMLDSSPADILLPTIAGIEGRSISVLLDQPKTAAWVSGDPDVIEYMYNVINEERRHCECNEPVVCTDKVKNALNLPAGMHEIRSGPHKGTIRVSRDTETDALVTPTKARRHAYIKIDATDIDETVRRANTWRGAAAHALDEESDHDDADHGDDCDAEV